VCESCDLDCEFPKYYLRHLRAHLDMTMIKHPWQRTNINFVAYFFILFSFLLSITANAIRKKKKGRRNSDQRCVEPRCGNLHCAIKSIAYANAIVAVNDATRRDVRGCRNHAECNVTVHSRLIQLVV